MAAGKKKTSSRTKQDSKRETKIKYVDSRGSIEMMNTSEKAEGKVLISVGPDSLQYPVGGACL